MPLRKLLSLSSELVPFAHAQALVELCGEFGLSREDLLAAAGVRSDVLSNPAGRLSLLDFYALVNAANASCHEPGLGLLLGQRLNASSHGILGYAVLSSPTLEDALRFVLKYYRVLGLTFELELVEHEQHMELQASESIPLGPLSRFAGEALMASFYSIARFLLGEVPKGAQVGFAFTAPDKALAARYRKVFGISAQFDQPWHWLRMPRTYLQRPLALANPATVQMCEQQCEALLSSLGIEDDLLSQVRRLLLARPGEFPNLDRAARALHTSGRSLRRHLAAAGTSYQQVLDEVRKRLAIQYLATTQLPLFEIAFLLGFSDPSNFRRAFHKWTGKQPGDYRETS